MITPRIAWGLDIGESVVKAVKIRRTRVGAEILAFDLIERGLPSEDSGDKDYHLREAVAALAERNKFGRAPVVVSIPEPAFSRFIPLPPVDKKRIPEVVRYEARQQIPFPIEEVVWDYQPVREAPEVGEETEVAIFSLRSQFVYALLANLSLCKIQPAAVLPVPLALYNFLTFDRDVAKGTIVIDMGAGSTDMLICDPENFRVRNITVSGNGITRALADRLKIGQAEAETLKRECKDKVQAARLFKLIQPTLNDLVGQVQRTIGFFKSQIHNVRIEQALLLGNTFRLPGVSDYFVGQLGCDLMPSDVLERVTLGGKVDSAALKEVLPSLSVAMGLALEGIGKGRVQVNLMPRELLRRQAVAKKRPYAAAAVVCLAAMLGADLYASKAAKTRMEAKLKSQSQIEKFTGERTKGRGKGKETIVDKYDKAKKQVGQELKALDEPIRLSSGSRACVRATNAINRKLKTLPDEIVLSRIEASHDTIKDQAGARRAAIRISISGRSEVDDARFLERRLKAPIKNAGFVVPEEKYRLERKKDGDRFTSYTFSIDCYYFVQ